MRNDQNLLLDMLSLNRQVSAATVAAITTERWQVLLDMAAMHRVAPLLYWRLIKERQLSLPQVVVERLQESYRQATFRSLQIQAELVALAKIFKREKVDYIVLKGPTLAFAMYPHSALRPMRDLDILVPKEQLERIYQLLLDSGFSHPAQYSNVNPQSFFALTQHYPGLKNPTGTVMFELHSRVLDPNICQGQDPGLNSELWQRRDSLTIAGQMIPVMAVTDLLLHLIIHGCHAHQFNNGPLLMSDIDYLLKSRSVDWPRFWQQAEQLQVSRGCQLTLTMVEYFYGRQKIEWLLGAVFDKENIERIVPELSLLMLQNFNLRVEQDRLAGFENDSSLRRKIRFLRDKFFPTPERLGLFYSVKKNSPWLPYYYLLNLVRIMKKIPLYWQVSNADGGDTMQMTALKGWLGNEVK